MSSYGLRALSDKAPAQAVAGVTAWAWADHHGFHINQNFPTGHVPTGWVWGWGDGVWVRWRTDAYAPAIGAELRRLERMQPPYERATVEVAQPADGLPSAVSERRFLKMVPGELDAALVREQPLTLVRVYNPAQLTFYALDGLAVT